MLGDNCICPQSAGGFQAATPSISAKERLKEEAAIRGVVSVLGRTDALCPRISSQRCELDKTSISHHKSEQSALADHFLAILAHLRTCVRGSWYTSVRLVSSAGSRPAFISSRCRSSMGTCEQMARFDVVCFSTVHEPSSLSL